MRLTFAQRDVLVVAWGAALYFTVQVVETRFGGSYLWVAYAPLSARAYDPHWWVQILIWLAMVASWAVGALWLLRRRPSDGQRATGGGATGKQGSDATH